MDVPPVDVGDPTAAVLPVDDVEPEVEVDAVVVVLLTVVLRDQRVVIDVVVDVPVTVVVGADGAAPRLIVTALLLTPDASLQVNFTVMLAYSGGVVRLPEVGTKFDRLPSVPMHVAADVVDQLTSDVPPLATVDGLADNWMIGAASARGSSASRLSAWRSRNRCCIGELRTSPRLARVDARSAMNQGLGRLRRVSDPRQIAFSLERVT